MDFAFLKIYPVGEPWGTLIHHSRTAAEIVGQRNRSIYLDMSARQGCEQAYLDM